MGIALLKDAGIALGIRGIRNHNSCNLVNHGRWILKLAELDHVHSSHDRGSMCLCSRRCVRRSSLATSPPLTTAYKSRSASNLVSLDYTRSAPGPLRSSGLWHRCRHLRRPLCPTIWEIVHTQSKNLRPKSSLRMLLSATLLIERQDHRRQPTGSILHERCSIAVNKVL